MDDLTLGRLSDTHAVQSRTIHYKLDFFVSFSQELHHYVEEYVNVYEADDDEEWRLVISEVTAFMEVISIGLDCEQFLFFWIIHVEERRTLSE